MPLFSKAKEKVKEKIDRMKEKSKQNMQSDEMSDLASKLRLHRITVRLRYIVAGSLAVIIIAGAAVFHYVRVFHSYSIVSSAERSDDAVTQYVRLKKGRTLKCNPNGVTCVNDKDEVQWNTTFNMQSLIVDVCETTVVVGDQRGSQIYVFNEKGLMGNFEVEHTLMKVKVAKQGVVAAVLEDGETTWVNIYDLEGNIIVKNKTSMGEMGYPVDVAISSDGLKMAVSYLGTNQNDVESRVAFYNFSSVGQGQTDNLVNSVTYEGHVVPEVRFLDSSHAVAFRDDGLTFFGGKQVPEEKKQIDVEQEIISVFCDHEYVGVVTASDEEEQTHKYKMQLFRSNGSRSMTKYFDMDYTNIKVSNGEIILYSGSAIKIYTARGKEKFSAEYEKQIVDVIQASGSKNYTVITTDSTDRIKIK